MTPTTHPQLECLSDDELTARLQAATRTEAGATARLVALLAEFEARRLHLAAGSPSLYAYCTERLHLSEHAAYGRTTAARAARRFPRVLDYLADGRITLTAVVLVAPELNGLNQVELLEGATHRSRRDIEAWLAGRRPMAPAPDRVRRVPEPRGGAPAPAVVAASSTRPAPLEAPGVSAGSAVPGRVDPPGGAGEVASMAPPRTPDHVPAGAPRPPHERLTPLDRAVYRVQFTAGAETYRRLMQVRELLRHRIPDGDLGAIFDRALRLLHDALARKKFALLQGDGGGRRSAAGIVAAGASRYIPAAVRRGVWFRDEGRCAFRGTDGHRCTERGRLEFHHRRPFARGGPATEENIELRCRAHNLYEDEG